jgi:hypothetical protein
MTACPKITQSLIILLPWYIENHAVLVSWALFMYMVNPMHYLTDPAMGCRVNSTVLLCCELFSCELSYRKITECMCVCFPWSCLTSFLLCVALHVQLIGNMPLVYQQGHIWIDEASHRQAQESMGPAPVSRRAEVAAEGLGSRTTARTPRLAEVMW